MSETKFEYYINENGYDKFTEDEIKFHLNRLDQCVICKNSSKDVYHLCSCRCKVCGFYDLGIPVCDKDTCSDEIEKSEYFIKYNFGGCPDDTLMNVKNMKKFLFDVSDADGSNG